MARAFIDGADGALREQLKKTQIPFEPAPPTARTPAARRSNEDEQASAPVQLPTGLEMFNGLGGFADGGREYVIGVHSRRGLMPPLAVGERCRQRGIRVRRHRIGPGLHLVDQQPREPADAVAERSGLRSAR